MQINPLAHFLAHTKHSGNVPFFKAQFTCLVLLYLDGSVGQGLKSALSRGWCWWPSVTSCLRDLSSESPGLTTCREARLRAPHDASSLESGSPGQGGCTGGSGQVHGRGEACSHPSVHNLKSVWAPPEHAGQKKVLVVKQYVELNSVCPLGRLLRSLRTTLLMDISDTLEDSFQNDRRNKLETKS